MNVVRVKKLYKDDVETMMEDLRDYYEDDRLSKKETAFYSNVIAALDNHQELSDEDVAKLLEIWEEYIS